MEDTETQFSYRPSGLRTHMNTHSNEKREFMISHFETLHMLTLLPQLFHVGFQVATDPLVYDPMQSDICAHTVSSQHRQPTQ